MRTTTLAVLILLTFGTAHAQEHKHKAFYKSGWWWAGRAVSAAVIIADGISTQEASHYCPTACGDRFLFFNPNTPGKAAGAGAISFGLSTLFSVGEYHFSQNIPTTKRVSGWHLGGYLAQPVTDAIAHGWAISNNYGLAADCRAGRLTCR